VGDISHLTLVVPFSSFNYYSVFLLVLSLIDFSSSLNIFLVTLSVLKLYTNLSNCGKPDNECKRLGFVFWPCLEQILWRN